MFKYSLYKILKICHLISAKKYKQLTAKYTKEYKCLARSDLFDPQWYLAQNPDLDPKKVDPIEHYLEHGWKEGRQGSPNFNEAEYLKTHPEAVELGVNPLFHCLRRHPVEKKTLFRGLLLWASNCTWFKRDIIVMCDCVFEPRATPIDNFTFFKYLMSPHFGSTRHLECPCCNEKSWCKRSKDKD